MIYLIILTIFFAPTFAIRFQIGGFFTNLLMVWVLVLWAVFGVRLLKKDLYKNFVEFLGSINKKFILALGLFFFAGIISLFVGGVSIKKFGQFLVLFVQPISLFFIAGFEFKRNPNLKIWVINSLYLFLAISGLYAIIQYFTLTGLPTAYWGNSLEPKRAISFFGHPDFYALFTAPVLAFLLPDLLEKIKLSIKKSATWVGLWLFGAVGLLLSLSRAGWLALGVIGTVYVLLSGNKAVRRLAVGVILAIVLAVLYFPNLRYRFITPFYGEKSSSSRVTLWKDGIRGIKSSPILGLGLNGFANNWQKLNTDPSLDTHNFPHNIFLDLWVDLGFLGMISFILICALVWFNRRGLERLVYTSLMLFVLTIFLQGQFDNPYFRNDLALIFWLIFATII